LPCGVHHSWIAAQPLEDAGGCLVYLGHETNAVIAFFEIPLVDAYLVDLEMVGRCFGSDRHAQEVVHEIVEVLADMVLPSIKCNIETSGIFGAPCM
jgi:hypothetical protein